MKKKRQNLAQIIGEIAPVQKDINNNKRKGYVLKRRIGKKMVKEHTVYLPIPVYEILRRIAFEERVKIHDLLMEGVEAILRDRGMPGIEELRQKSDEG